MVLLCALPVALGDILKCAGVLNWSVTYCFNVFDLRFDEVAVVSNAIAKRREGGVYEQRFWCRSEMKCLNTDVAYDAKTQNCWVATAKPFVDPCKSLPDSLLFCLSQVRGQVVKLSHQSSGSAHASRPCPMQDVQKDMSQLGKLGSELFFV